MDGMDGMDGMGPFVQELLADDDHAHLHDVPLETTACNIPLSEAKGSTFQWKTWGTSWTRPIDGPILPHTLPIKVGIFWLAMLYKLPESMRVYVFFWVVGCDMGRRRFVGLWACSVQNIGLLNSWKCARQTCQTMRILQSSFCRPFDKGPPYGLIENVFEPHMYPRYIRKIHP